MNIFHGRSIKAKLLTFTGIFVLGLAVFGVVSLTTLSKVKVNGPIYEDLTRGMTLLADILPPPAYVVETLLVVHEIKDATEQTKIAELTERIDKLKKEYNDRHAYWDAALPRVNFDKHS